jgi:hypothetical protein
MNAPPFFIDPLRGKTSLARVVWLYGVVGSLLYGAIELFLDPANATLMRIYSVGGFLLSVYVSVATYRCAFNTPSRFWGRTAQVSAVLSLLLLPFVAYLDFTGAFSFALLGEQ